VRIVSLLPSATEIVYALGLEDDLVGVTHECDFPPAAVQKPVVSVSALPPAATAIEVDALVSASLGEGEPIYRLDEVALRDLRPDLVLTQDLCAVCAVPSGHVDEALEVLGCRAEVLSMDPSSLDEVMGCVERVGAVTGVAGRARSIVEGLRRRLVAVDEAVAGLPRQRTFALEWSDPPFNGGHWVAEMIERAGGDPVLVRRGEDSVRVTWEEIAEVDPEVVVFMPCGYDAEAAATEAVSFVDRGELSSVEALFAVDASSFFSRPGPRLVDGVEILASALHPGAVVNPVPDALRRLR
jgi:iron complex transport system substrate-binding protein